MTILFDLDGTLIDSTEAIVESFYHSYDFHGRARPDEAAIVGLIGHPLDVMYRELGIEVMKVTTYVETYKAHYRRISKEKTVLLEGAKEALEMASQFARMGVVTTKTGLYSRELLEHFGVMHHFEVLIGREDVVYPKPHPEPIEKAMLHMACDRKMCWMIGDTLLDVEAAQRASVQCVAVSCGYETEHALSQSAPMVVEDALDAVRYIAEVVKDENNVEVVL